MPRKGSTNVIFALRTIPEKNIEGQKEVEVELHQGWKESRRSPSEEQLMSNVLEINAGKQFEMRFGHK